MSTTFGQAQNSQTSTDFPFIYLHNEIVKYFQERDKEVAAQRQEWMQRLKQSNGSEMLDGPEGNLLTSQIFSQVFLCIFNQLNLIILKKNAETRLESIGYRVGYVLSEKLSKDMPRFLNELDRMKFICKEFWAMTFGKGVNKLSTNHQVKII
jgi:hypothetical protein